MIRLDQAIAAVDAEAAPKPARVRGGLDVRRTSRGVIDHKKKSRLLDADQAGARFGNVNCRATVDAARETVRKAPRSRRGSADCPTARTKNRQ